jgi:hypothetical protein
MFRVYNFSILDGTAKNKRKEMKNYIANDFMNFNLH